MKHILILLLFAGLGVKGQTKLSQKGKDKIAKIIIQESEMRINDSGRILIGGGDTHNAKLHFTGMPYGGYDDPKGIIKMAAGGADTCQKYRDSVIRYAANIKMWQRRISPLNPAGYNMLINKEISRLEAIRKKYRKLADKCK